MLLNMSTALLPDTARIAKRVVAGSERAAHDPFTTIDWTTPIDDRAYDLPPEALPLFEELGAINRFTKPAWRLLGLVGNK